jgi:glutaconate CoA-transferase subunit A
VTEFRKLEKCIRKIRNGEKIAIGGNLTHRTPIAAVYEIIRQKKRNLDIVKTAGAFDIDLLCAFGAVKNVWAGYVGYESDLGFNAMHYRRGVEEGKVVAKENACYTVISAMRAARQGVPFMPVNTLEGSDLRSMEYYSAIENPFNKKEKVYVVRALKPDFAIVHAQLADEEGNVLIRGSKFEDILMLQAARRTIVTVEEVVESLSCEFEMTVPSFMVDYVVELKYGAHPTSCYLCYDTDLEFIKNFQSYEDMNKFYLDYIALSRDEYVNKVLREGAEWNIRSQKPSSV